MLSEIREIQISYDFIHMRTLSKNREGDKTEETHKYGEQTGLLEGLWEGDGLNLGKGLKESTPEIIVALYAK